MFFPGHFNTHTCKIRYQYAFVRAGARVFAGHLSTYTWKIRYQYVFVFPGSIPRTGQSDVFFLHESILEIRLSLLYSSIFK